MVTGKTDRLSSVLAEPSWHEVVEAFAESGLVLSVVRTGSSVVHARCPVCPLPVGAGQAIPASDCVDRALLERLTCPTLVTCSAEASCALHRITANGAILGHAMVSGFVMTASERKQLLARLRGIGLAEKEARAIARKTPVLDARRARAMAKVASAHVEALLTTVVPVREGTTRGLEYEVLYEFGRGFGTSLEDYESLPGMILDRALRLTSAEAGVLMLVGDDPEQLETVASRGDETFKAPRSVRVGEGMAGRVARTGHSMMVTGKRGTRTRTASLAVPLRHEARLLGVLLLSAPNAGRDTAEELKLLDLYAETAGTALANARRYSETNHLMLELMQLNELSRALQGDSEIDRITYLVTGVLDKVLDFEVGGLIVFGRHEHGRVLLRTELSRGDLLGLLGQVVGMDLGEGFLEKCALVATEGALIEDDAAPPPKWNIAAASVSTANPCAGYLFAASRDPAAFSSADIRVLGAEASHASVALEKARVYSRMREDLSRLTRAVSAMVDAAERCTKGHADRVMDYAVAIGEEMGLALEDVETLRFAGLLHDIGKFGVSEEILLKPTTLAEDEMAQVRLHAEMGADIVAQMDFLGALGPVIMHHHERWDGGGYPLGLAADEIPLLGRILAVADAFDAMTCDRTYSKALPYASARIELERGSGAQFDPRVVEVFLSILDREADAGATGLFASSTDGKPELLA
jgi:putative nucleotidyltransferase with HDIG domain